MSAEKSTGTSKLSVVPASIEFQSVVVGEKNSQALKITNVSSEIIDLRQFHVSGTGFAVSNVKAPVTLAPGQNASLSVVFTPATSAATAGSLLIVSPDLNSPVTIPLSGSGEKPSAQLKLSTGSINFGSHGVNSSAFQSAALTNTGNVKLKLDSVSAVSSPFSIVGLTRGVSLAPDQQLDFQVWFRPTSPGTSAATITLAATGLGTPLKLAVSGRASESSGEPPDTGTAAHAVQLAWDAGSGSASGYHIYRGATSGGPYNRINAHAISALTYKDAEIGSGRYYYVVTAVTSDDTESAYSNEVAVEIPNS